MNKGKFNTQNIYISLLILFLICLIITVYFEIKLSFSLIFKKINLLVNSEQTFYY